MFLDGLCIYAFMPLLVISVTYLCMTWMANIISIPYTLVYHYYFPHYRSGGDCIHTRFQLLTSSPFSMMSKGGRWVWPRFD